MEFMRTFDKGEAIVWGSIVIATKDKIEEVIGLPANVEHYLNEHDARSLRAQLSQSGDLLLEISKQGCKRLSLPISYLELVTHIIKYLTYEGRFSNLYTHHFKLLSCVRHNI